MNVADRTPTDVDLTQGVSSGESPATSVPIFATFYPARHISPASIDPGALGRITAEIVIPQDFRSESGKDYILGWSESVDCQIIYTATAMRLYEGDYNTLRYGLNFDNPPMLYPGERYAIRVTKLNDTQLTYAIFWHDGKGIPLASLTMGWGGTPFQWTHLRTGMPSSYIVAANTGFEGPTLRTIPQMRVNSVITEVTA